MTIPRNAALAALLLLCTAARADEQAQDGDVLSLGDGQGNVLTVFNQFDGNYNSFWVTKMTAGGARVWSYQHSDVNFEKARAAAVDFNGNLFIAGVRNWSQQKNFLLLKYDQNGALAWESVDDRSNCTATSVAVDKDGGVALAGVCRSGDNFPARIVKYSNDGTRLWYQEYDQGGRNYVRRLQADYQGNLSISVETVSGDYQEGSYISRTVTYSPYGRFLDSR